jgi:uncharacterized membrane protein
LRSSFSDRRVAVLSVLVLSAVVADLVVFRVAYTGTSYQTNLVWNLSLTWTPLVLALLLYDRHVRHAGLTTLAGLGMLWLLFFPNAPYIVTDFKYLAGSTGEKFWYDGALIGTAATTGLMLGFVSLYLLQAIVRQGVGARPAWIFVFVSLGLGAFGVYVGRVLRWNSWDVFVQPGSLAAKLARGLADPLGHRRPSRSRASCASSGSGWARPRSARSPDGMSWVRPRVEAARLGRRWMRPPSRSRRLT